MNTVTELLQNLNARKVVFNDVLAFINEHYDFSPTAFSNGNVDNNVEQNQGSCRVFSLAQLHKLTEAETLSLFAEHYQNVLNNPDDDNHQNIRQFMQHGWAGVSFSRSALVEKV